MVILAGAAVAAVSGCGGGGGGSGAGPQALAADVSQTFVPIAQGNRWAYRVAQTQTGIIAGRSVQRAVAGAVTSTSTYIDTMRVTGTRTVSGTTVLVMTDDNAYNSGTAETYYLKNAAGIFCYGDTGSPLSQALGSYQVARFPIVTGDTFVAADKAGLDYGADLDGDHVNEQVAVRIEVRVSSIDDSVTVDAGRFFHCVKIDTTATQTVTFSRTGDRIVITTTKTEWFAQNVGLVRSIVTVTSDSGSSTEERGLIAYSVDGRSSDTFRPSVSSGAPTGLTGGLAASAITATFSEEMAAYSISTANFTVTGSGGPIQGSVAVSGRKATFTPRTPLPAGTYTAAVAATPCDLAGNLVTGGYSWTFTVDPAIPAITAATPLSGATGVSVTTAVTATFDKDMDPNTINAANFTLKGNGTQVVGGITYSNRVATFTPLAALVTGTQYTATVTNNARDLAGNSLALYSWNFTTEGTPPSTGGSGGSSGGSGSSNTTGGTLFPTYLAIKTSSWPEAVAIGDVNGDGRNDVIMVTSYYFDATSDYKLFVFLQNADGTLAAPVKYATLGTYTHPPSTVAIGDVNHDGKNEVVVGLSGLGLQVFTRNAGGGLDAGSLIASTDSEKIRTGDVNGDGLVDVVGIGWGTNTVSVFLQNSSGSLDIPIVYTAKHAGYDDLELGDLNNDGRLDVVVMSGQSYSAPNFSVLLQKADGTLDTPATYSIGTNKLTYGLAIGDVTGDGLPDVVVTDTFDAQIYVFAQTAGGTLAPPVSYQSGQAEPVQIADVDNNSKKDVVVVHSGGTVGIYRQLGNGTLNTEELFTTTYATHFNPHGLALGDINSDGLNDIVMANYNAGLVVLYQGGGPVGTGRRQVLPLASDLLRFR